MKARFTQSFKIQAVKKALERANDVSLKDIADDLRIGQSTLGKWIGLAQKQKIEPAQNTEVTPMIKAERPQDWSAKARLDMVISCALSISVEKFPPVSVQKFPLCLGYLHCF